MKQWFLLMAIVQLVLMPHAFSQEARIVDVKGKVLVKQDIASRWRRARVDMSLAKSAEIKTSRQAWCTVTFDGMLDNVLTIKENSSIKIESIAPAHIGLPEGRVFSLIDDIAKIQEFEVKTPVAVAGVRGTGKSVKTGMEGTTVKCFEGTTYVRGKGSDTKNIPQGKGIDVGSDGSLGPLFNLTGKDYQGWKDFKDYIKSLKTKGDDTDDDWLTDLWEERKQDFRDSVYEERRRDAEKEPQRGGQEPTDDGGDYLRDE